MAEVALAAAGIVLSPFLQVFFERMASRESDDCYWPLQQKLSDRLLSKLKIALLSVDAVLEDAEGKQFTETDVKVWLDELKDTVYDVEDILDEIATKDLQRKLGTIASKVIWSEIQAVVECPWICCRWSTTPRHFFSYLLLNGFHSLHQLICHLPIGLVNCAGTNWVKSS